MPPQDESLAMALSKCIEPGFLLCSPGCPASRQGCSLCQADSIMFGAPLTLSDVLFVACHGHGFQAVIRGLQQRCLQSRPKCEAKQRVSRTTTIASCMCSLVKQDTSAPCNFSCSFVLMAFKGANSTPSACTHYHLHNIGSALVLITASTHGLWRGAQHAWALLRFLSAFTALPRC